MTLRVVIIGAGDLGQTLAAELTEAHDMRLSGFYDDMIAASGVPDIDGVRILGALSDIYRGHAAGAFDAVLMGIGYKHLQFRAQLCADLAQRGILLATFVHHTAYVHPTATIGTGSILFPRCVVDAKARIGANSLLYTGSIVAHDTLVGDGSFLGPGVTLAGFVTIGAGCFIGAGTVVKNNLRLGDGSCTGAGAVVVKDVPAGILVVGVPARPTIPPD
jgi:sugar O-acyltransferase (sialic acid O-acetyltransferase NeuD family)